MQYLLIDSSGVIDTIIIYECSYLKRCKAPVSRHSRATIALRKGVSIEIISEGMGYENETTTRIYLVLLGQSVVDPANAKIITME